MKLLGWSPTRSRARRRGSALLLAFFVLLVLAAIVFQLSIGTQTDARVARNDLTLTSMDLAIESALLEVYDRLGTDAESAAASGGTEGSVPGDAGGDPGAGEVPGAAGAPAGEQSQAVDSHEDSWGKPQRTTINEIELRILVQDEDSKLNVLGMLTEDEDEARKALERVVRVIDLCREGTSADIDLADARRMAEEMRDYMESRSHADLPRPKLLSDDEEKEQRGLPLSLEEFGVLEHWNEGHFRDFRDERGRVVHALGSFLTVWTSLSTNDEVQAAKSEKSGEGGASDAGGNDAGGNDSGGNDSGGNDDSNDGQDDGGGNDAGGGGEQDGGAGDPQAGGQGGAAEGQAGGATSTKGGVAVNLNTAPIAVLKSLMDDRDVPYRFWDEVLEYRNLEEEPADGEEAAEPVLDEFGNEVIQRQIFDSLEELEEINGFDRIDHVQRNELLALLDTQSHVFTIYVTARRATGLQDGFGGYRGSPRSDEKEDLLGNALTRTVRALVWRRPDGDSASVVSLVRWEVLDYTPFEVQDFPDENR